MTLPVGPTDEQLGVELRAAAILTNELRQQLEVATRQIAALYIGLAGSLSQPLPPPVRRRFADAAGQIIARVAVDIRVPLWEMVLQALDLGQQSATPFVQQVPARLRSYSQHTYDQLVAGLQQLERPPATVHQWVVALAAAAQARIDAQLLSAQSAGQVGAPPADFAEVLARIIAPAEQALTGLERDARWATNAGFNMGVREVADLAGVSRMWIAERDACLHCLALSGEIAGPGQPYNASLTFYIGPNGLFKPLPVYPVGPLWGPPRHPNCRCFQRPAPVLAGYPVQPWESGPYTPSQALKREARRSVLRGVSGSDSLPARLRATDALLAVGAGLPVSVERRARQAVRRGGYGGR
jgi:hypothetical protein